MFHCPASIPALRTRFAALSACLFALLLTCVSPARAQDSHDPIYVFHTSLGDINVQLFPDIAPQTVANFLSYVNAGSYNSSFFHRSPPGFVIQGGGYTVDANANVNAIATNAPVTNEFHLSNTRGTIAMAKVGSDPNSATSQWFFNEQDNSSNLDNQNGGFTVFGRVIDSAGLAVMDAIAAVPIYNEGSPFDQLPLMNYQSGAAVTQSNFVRVTSITPKWTAVAVSVGTDNLSHLLWDNADGRTAAWTLSPSGTAASSPILQPGGNWSAQDISQDTQGATHVLWTNTDGRMTVWTITKANAISSLPIFQPGGGWAAQALSMDTQGNAHVLWFNTDGHMSVWTITPGGSVVSTPLYQPGSGWSARSLSVDSAGSSHVLWTNTDGRMAVWTITSVNGVSSSPVYQPGSGWGARKVSVDSGGISRVLWFNGDGRMAVWSLSGSSVRSSSIYSAGTGWSAQGLCVDSAGSSRVLWGNGDGRTAVWSITSGNAVTSTPIYQP